MTDLISSDLSEDMKYNIIYADPAWQFNNKKTGGSMKSGAASQYRVTSIEDMETLNVQNIAADNCVLIMWWVGAMPQEAIDLVSAWGFVIKNMNGFVWNKLTKKGLPHFGMGFYTRAGSESAIIATKGKVKPTSHSVRAVISHATGKHSEKPNIFREKIVELFGDLPRVELFARGKFEGWDCWGDELIG
jgi:N6-adenosine-specific RNA methylase IME4